MGGPTSNPEKLVAAKHLFAVALGYFLAGEVGRLTAPVAGFPPVIQAPAGVALAALLIGGYGLWPAIMVGALATSLLRGAAPLVACGLAAAATIEALFGALALRRISGFRSTLDRFQDILALVGIAAVVGSALGASLAVANLALGGVVSPGALGRAWLTWWTGDLVSTLVVAPALLAWAAAPRPDLRPAKLVEAVLLGGFLLASAFVIFARRPEMLSSHSILRPYLLFLPLTVAALRFNMRGAATGTLLVAIAAIWGTCAGRGDFAREGPVTSLFAVEGFLVAAALATLGIGAVMSEREQSRRRLDEREAFLRSVLDGTSDAIYAKDCSGRYVIMNAPGAGLFGLPPEAITGKKDHALFSPEEASAVVAVDRDVMESGRSRDADEHLTIGGQPRVYHTTKAPYRDGAGNLLGVIGISRDITARRQAESELIELRERRHVEQEVRALEQRQQSEVAALLARERAARTEAQAAASAKDEFLAVLSHELRTPLQSMLGWTQMLKAKRVDERTVDKGLETIERNVRAQAQLIDDLLDISRIVTGVIPLDREPVDLRAVVEAALASAAVPAAARSIEIDAVLDEGVGAVLGDRDRLQQIVANVLGNAVKFTPRGGRVAVRLERDGSSARIVVVDEGRGIAADFLPHVFERFRQAESTTRRSHGGLGIGLAIVHHLVELHGGTVTAASAGEHQGATFIVTLPLASRSTPGPAPVNERATPTTGATEASLVGARVLVVDDDPDTCELLVMVLRDAGSEVAAAHSVRDALALMASFRPDLLVSDIGMPGEDGYALIRRVRADEAIQGGHLPAVALTAFTGRADRDQAICHGFDEHIAKPVSPAELTWTTASLLQKPG
jgi:PAS domain S-box-containing protein